MPTAAAVGHPTSDCGGARRTDSDGLPSDKRLEELKAGDPGDQIFSNRVMHRGREFFTAMGTSCTESEPEMCHMTHSWASIFGSAWIFMRGFPPWKWGE